MAFTDPVLPDSVFKSLCHQYFKFTKVSKATMDVDISASYDIGNASARTIYGIAKIEEYDKMTSSCTN